MAWSTPFSETIGGLVAVISGHFASEFVKSQIKNSEMNERVQQVVSPLASAVTATTVHLLAGGTTKALINGSMLDPVGAGASVITTPSTALLHGVYELTKEFPQELIPKIVDEGLKSSKNK